MKKKKITIVIVSVLLAASFTACDKPPIDDGENINYSSIIDTLKGEWSWFKTSGGQGFVIDNKFKSIIKILNQNKDNSINYEVFVDDTLFYKENFQFQQHGWNIVGFKYLNIKLPHWIPSLLSSENWFVLFSDMSEEYDEISGRFKVKLTKDTLTFWDGASDGYYFHYEKIIKK